MTETDLQAELDKLQDFPRHAGGGSDGHMNLLRERNPIPEFDDRVEFYDWCVVASQTNDLLYGVECSNETGNPIVVDAETRSVVDFDDFDAERHLLLEFGTENTYQKLDTANHEALLNHKYFVDKRLMDGSMTGFLHTLSKPYATEENLRRISQSFRPLVQILGPRVPRVPGAVARNRRGPAVGGARHRQAARHA